jgi:hypothetical protein
MVAACCERQGKARAVVEAVRELLRERGKSTWPCHPGSVGDRDGWCRRGMETAVAASVGTGGATLSGAIDMVRCGRAGVKAFGQWAR